MLGAAKTSEIKRNVGQGQGQKPGTRMFLPTNTTFIVMPTTLIYEPLCLSYLVAASIMLTKIRSQRHITPPGNALKTTFVVSVTAGDMVVKNTSNYNTHYQHHNDASKVL